LDGNKEVAGLKGVLGGGEAKKDSSRKASNNENGVPLLRESHHRKEGKWENQGRKLREFQTFSEKYPRKRGEKQIVVKTTNGWR